MEEIRNSSCPYRTCDSCVNCNSGKCIWMPVGSNRGCYNTDQLSTSFLNSNQQYIVQTLGQCRNCSMDKDTSSQWGHCKGCPSIQERIVECVSVVNSKVVDDDLCSVDEKPIAARPCDNTKQNIIDEFTYTPWKEKRHWQYAWHIPNTATKYPVDKKCNAQCVRWCDARAFTNTFLPSSIDPVTTGYKVINAESEEYAMCKRPHRNPTEALPSDKQTRMGTSGFFTMPSPNPCKTGAAATKHSKVKRVRKRRRRRRKRGHSVVKKELKDILLELTNMQKVRL